MLHPLLIDPIRAACFRKLIGFGTNETNQKFLSKGMVHCFPFFALVVFKSFECSKSTRTSNSLVAKLCFVTRLAISIVDLLILFLRFSCRQLVAVE
jgi:hypothetical protein